MPIAAAPESLGGKFAGVTVAVSGVGQVTLTHLLHENSETSIYAVSQPGLVVKVFDLECQNPEEVSYGPYLSYKVEVENWEDIRAIPELRSQIPAYYGSDFDFERKFAFIAMEYLEGQNLLAWCQSAAALNYSGVWAEEFRAAVYETLAIVALFHEHGIILIDFKPDNVIRICSGIIKFVDLGAFFTPRHALETEKYIYSATPDYAELVIDTSNVRTGQPLKQGADIFSAGVALFEMASGDSRLAMASDCADSMLKLPGTYLFRDSQIKDIWRAYPHLKTLLPLVHTQLLERRILFAEFWHLLKGYLASQVAEWDSLSETQHREMLLATGTTFIADQLPAPLQWLADPIARATTLRSFRLATVAELMEMLGVPVSPEVQEDLETFNPALELGRASTPPLHFRSPLNVWEVRYEPESGHWAISSTIAAWCLRKIAHFVFLRETHGDLAGNRFFQICIDSEADLLEGEPLTLKQLADVRWAWIGL
jgi:serine/threonine protein kinase